MSNEEIFRSIALDVYTVGKSGGDVTIWMTSGLFDRLLPEPFTTLLPRPFTPNKNHDRITLFGCNVKVIYPQSNSLQWIVGYEGTAEEGE